jgi:anti-anti-sigma factor
MDCVIQENSQLDTVVLVMDGCIDAETAPVFNDYLSQVEEKKMHNIVLDFSNISHVSSQGVSVLVQRVIEINKTGAKVQTVGMSDKVKAVFDILQLSKFFF